MNKMTLKHKVTRWQSHIGMTHAPGKQTWRLRFQIQGLGARPRHDAHGTWGDHGPLKTQEENHFSMKYL